MNGQWIYRWSVVPDGASPLKEEDIRFTSVSVMRAYIRPGFHFGWIYELEWYRV